MIALKICACALGLAVTLYGERAVGQTPTPDFAVSAAQSDEYEIEAARVAVAQSQNPNVRAFAEQMIKDHTFLSDRLREAMAASGSPPPPAAMGSDQAMMLAALQSLRGSDFDRAYVRQQLLAHDQALAVGQSYARAGSDLNLREMARAGTVMIQHHLEMASHIGLAPPGS